MPRYWLVCTVLACLAIYFRRPLGACASRVRRLPELIIEVRGRFEAPNEELQAFNPAVAERLGGEDGSPPRASREAAPPDGVVRAAGRAVCLTGQRRASPAITSPFERQPNVGAVAPSTGCAVSGVGGVAAASAVGAASVAISVGVGPSTDGWDNEAPDDDNWGDDWGDDDGWDNESEPKTLT